MRKRASLDPSLFCWAAKLYVRKEKSLLKGIYFIFLQEVTYQLSSNCGTFILHYRIIKHKHIQRKSFKTELKRNSLFFMPGKAVGRQLQRLIMVYKVFWLWEFDHSCKVLDNISVKYSSVIKAWQFCFLLNSGHFWSEQEARTTQVAAGVDW